MLSDLTISETFHIGIQQGFQFAVFAFGFLIPIIAGVVSLIVLFDIIKRNYENWKR